MGLALDALLVLAASTAHAAERPSPNMMRGDGVVADIVAVPEGMSVEALASQLIEAENLEPWSRRPTSEEHGLTVSSLWGNDGRVVAVYWRILSPESTSTRVCRIRAEATSSSAVRHRALQWCGSVFGIRVPEPPPAPVIVRPHPED